MPLRTTWWGKVVAGNRLLRAMAGSDVTRLKPHVEEVTLQQGETLYQPEDPLTHVYFPHDAVISLQILGTDGALVEAATIGREGMAGLGGSLPRDNAFTRQLVQLRGRAAKVERKALLDIIEGNQSLKVLFTNHADAFASHILQSVACNASHSTEARLARWLLSALDRCGGNRISLTHDDLAIAFGVRRPTVTLTVRSLQAAGLLDGARGTITVVDRSGLEQIACECYHIIKKNYERVYRSRRR
jgi:CRP-like cAMP-binding protein